MSAVYPSPVRNVVVKTGAIYTSDRHFRAPDVGLLRVTISVVPGNDEHRREVDFRGMGNQYHVMPSSSSKYKQPLGVRLSRHPEDPEMYSLDTASLYARFDT